MMNYFPFMYQINQYFLGPWGYAREPNYLINYQENSAFLPFINNEVGHSEFDMYKHRTQNLNAFTAVQFDKDTAVFPKSSELFDQYTDTRGYLRDLDKNVYREFSIQEYSSQNYDQWDYQQYTPIN